jgi:hypothetical protein
VVDGDDEHDALGAADVLLRQPVDDLPCLLSLRTSLDVPADVRGECGPGVVGDRDGQARIAREIAGLPGPRAGEEDVGIVLDADPGGHDVRCAVREKRGHVRDVGSGEQSSESVVEESRSMGHVGWTSTCRGSHRRHRSALPARPSTPR